MARPNFTTSVRLLVATIATAFPFAARADRPPLHDRIDALIAARAEGASSAPLADDAEFLRRVSLDLTATIPTADAARDFLADADPGKRAKLIDRLLASPEYPRRLGELLNVMLMERRDGSGDNDASKAWREYLHTAAAENKPWDQVAREVLSPDAKDPITRGAALFFTKRLETEGAVPIDYPGLTRDVGRLFLGVDLKCAQCHNHKYIKDYTQADYQGLAAFVSETFIRKEGSLPGVGEKPLAPMIEYVSVFKPDLKQQTAPHVPGGPNVVVPVFEKGQEFAEPPDRKAKTPGVLKFRPLVALAEQMTRPDNVPFRRNIANRLWFAMLGRGIVHPLDLHHQKNPPSHPELLDALADELAATKFDVRAFLREVALSETYQRSSLLPRGVAESPPDRFLVANAKRLSAEQLMWSTLTATGEMDVVLKARMDDSTPDLPTVRKKFLAAFANPAGEPEVEFAPSVAAALFVSNDRVVLDRLTPRAGNLADRLLKLTDDHAAAEELYLSVLTRLPTDEERLAFGSYLRQRGADARRSALGEFAWSLLASTEFCVNH